MDKRIPLVIGLIVLLAIIGILFFTLNNTDVSKRDYCQFDSDCVPAQCCHPTEAVNDYYAPDCKNVVCTQVCEGPLECRRGRIECIQNKCTVVPNNVSN